ncbi:polysaccharide pyruvyl transferase family protein [Nostocoides vanveenii]|uniref:Polysaccharide pyruvyl transferase domain-containing protein n=1 Tax=Nostocoides vanveenii TaxID=330835 RepID=A0ABP4WA71_9MICO
MVDVGVLTFHRASNYGAVLQTWALQEAISALGHSSEVVDYRSPFLEAHYQPDGWRTMLSPRKIGIALLRNGYMLDRRPIFEDFVRREIPLSTDAYTPDTVEHALDSYSIFLTGSDQVWNPLTAGFDPAYFLEFVPEGHRKRAYAASIGLEAIPHEHQPRFQELLADFKQISVRESTGAAILKEMLGDSPPVVADPTLLVDAPRWRTLGEQGHNWSEPYTLVYLLAETPAILRYARRLAKSRGNRIVYVSQRLFQPRGMRVLSRATVYDFVALFAGADSVVTNSFHGMCFALNLSLDLHFDFLPEPARVNSRLRQLIEAYDIDARQIPPEGLLPRTSTDMQVHIGETIERERTRSMNILAQIIDES